MMKNTVKLLTAALLLSTSSAYAADCKAPKAAADMSVEDLSTLYECLRPSLLEGYQKKENELAMAYTDWKAASSAPQAPGMHSGQYLMTYVNDEGYDAYTQYATSDVAMPVGTQIAKEAFTIKANGSVKKGPLLFMEKVGMDAAPDTGGWKYSGLKPKGKKLKVDEKGFCHACHQAWPGQDYLGYPVQKVRISAN